MPASPDATPVVPAAPAADSLPVGTTVDRYVLSHELGRGGMGVVYRAYDPRLQREVAIKVLRSDGAGSRGRRRILREARTMAKLSHPNLVQVYDVTPWGSGLIAVMELIEGVSARCWRDETGPSWRRIVEVYLAAGRGLAAAHAAGVVHRDFKPGNVLVADDGSVRVADFGLSRWQHDPDVGDDTHRVGVPEGGSETDALTREGSVMGTPSYMAPEQAMGGLADEVSDQYSFCVTLWEALYGERPFPDEGIHAARLQGPPPRPRSKVPAYVHRVLARGLSPSTVDRFASMDELLSVLSGDRLRRRRRWVAASAGLGCVGAAVGLQPVLDARASASCRDASTAADLRWSDAQRAETRAGMLASGASFASETWPRVQHGLDDYVQRWSSAWEEACEAIETDAEEAQMCLREALIQLDTEVAGLTAATPESVRSAVGAVDALPEPASCLRPSVVAGRYPSDPVVREAVVEIRNELARARGMTDAGDVDGALAVAVAACEAAERAEWKPVAAEAWFVVADLEELRGEFSMAQESLRRAFAVAMEAGQDRIAGRVARKLCWVQGIRVGSVASALTWCEFAEALYQRTETSDAQWALLADTRGTLLGEAGRSDEAELELDRALRLRRRALGERHPWVATTLAELGLVRAQQGHLAESRVLQEEALSILEGALGRRHPRTGQMLMNLGNLARKMDDREEAVAYYLRALTITEAGLGNTHPIVGSILTAIGMARFEAGDLEGATPALVRAVDLLERPSAGPSPELGMALRTLARVQRGRGALEDARATFTRAHAVFFDIGGADSEDTQAMQRELAGL